MDDDGVELNESMDDDGVELNESMDDDGVDLDKTIDNDAVDLDNSMNDDAIELYRSLDDDFMKVTGAQKLSYEDLASATNNFSEKEKLGKGGFGSVYRGLLKELDCYVAVKRLSNDSEQGVKEYASEVKIISQLRHENIVQLMGWCHERKELLLVYEFMPNGSLDFHLFKDNNMLPWEMRYKIARGLASGLLYLHQELECYVVHRDIKASNIMLDSSFTAKIGDFGLARLGDHGKGLDYTPLASTVGYVAPEYATTGRASKESDVYSFGIVALEIACGRKAIRVGLMNLRDWVWDLYGKGKILEAADPRLNGEFDEQQVECLMMVGLSCAHPDPKLRPTMENAIHFLNFAAPVPDLPSEMPMFSYLGTFTSSSKSSNGASSQQTVIFGNSMAKMKMVIWLPLNDDKTRSKAMRIAISLCGVQSVALRDKNLIEVIGDGVDPVKLIRFLRKKMGKRRRFSCFLPKSMMAYAELVSVAHRQERLKEERR